MGASLGGTVEITKLVEHVCRLIVKYRSKIDHLIAAGVIGGSITSGQGATLTAWLDATQGACLIWKALTGY